MAKKVRDSSKDAYELIEDLSGKRREVYKAIEALGECCDVDIAEYLGWSINRVTGRRNELEKKGLVASVGRRLTSHSNVAVHHWKTTQ